MNDWLILTQSVTQKIGKILDDITYSWEQMFEMLYERK